MSSGKMNNKLKSILILFWIAFFYIVHYYFEIKKYAIDVPNYILKIIIPGF